MVGPLVRANVPSRTHPKIRETVLRPGEDSHQLHITQLWCIVIYIERG